MNSQDLYPLDSITILNNKLLNPTPNSAHMGAILSVEIFGAKPNKLYAIETIYDGFIVGGSPRYGVTIGCFDRLSSGKVDANSYKSIFKITDIPDSTVTVLGDVITKFYDIQEHKIRVAIVYSRNNMESYKDNRLSYISGGNFYECIIREDRHVVTELHPFKILNVLGDSLTSVNATATKRYHDWIGDWLGIKVNNYGISGSTVGNKHDPMSERYAAMDSNADVITVFGGTNDFGRNQPLGTMADRTNDTFYGAMHVLLTGLLNKYFDRKIGFISLHHFGTGYFAEKNSFGLIKSDYVKATKEVCEYYSIPLLNLYHSGGFNLEVEAQKTLYSTDSLHFNNEGHKRLAKLIYEFILRL